MRRPERRCSNSLLEGAWIASQSPIALIQHADVTRAHSDYHYLNQAMGLLQYTYTHVPDFSFRRVPTAYSTAQGPTHIEHQRPGGPRAATGFVTRSPNRGIQSGE